MHLANIMLYFLRPKFIDTWVDVFILYDFAGELKMIKRIILPYGYGQTCNQLLQIAHWIPSAVVYDIPLYFPGFKRYAHMFSGTIENNNLVFPSFANQMPFSQALLSKTCSIASKISHVNLTPFFKMASILPGVEVVSVDDSGRSGSISPLNVLDDKKISSGESLWVQGWLYRDYEGMSKYKKIIKEFFSPIPDIQDRINKCIKRRDIRHSLLFGVHLRRGDYKKWENGKYYYDDNSMSLLMQQVYRLFPEKNISFLLVSNEHIELDNYKRHDVFMGPGDPAGDLYSLAECDYIIGPPSTYTSWASFFGDVPLCFINNPNDSLSLDDFKVCLG